MKTQHEYRVYTHTNYRGDTICSIEAIGCECAVSHNKKVIYEALDYETADMIYNAVTRDLVFRHAASLKQYKTGPN